VGQALRKVAEEVARRGVDLLRVQPDVVRRRDELLEQLGRFVDPACPGEARGEPERAGEEGAFARRQAVRAAVAVDERPSASSRRIASIVPSMRSLRGSWQSSSERVSKLASRAGMSDARIKLPRSSLQPRRS
jgi:hypothetical protein